jgi:hypothetical protein
MSVYDQSVAVYDFASTLLREKYMPLYAEQTTWLSTTNRLFKPSTDIAYGDGINLQVETAYADSARSKRNPLADFDRSSTFVGDKIKARFNDTGDTANDFVRLSASATVTELTQMNGAEQAAVDIAARVFDQILKDIDSKKSVLRNLPRSGRLALVNGTPKNNDKRLYASASSYTSNSTSCRIKVDAGSIGTFQPGRVLDIYNAAGSLLFAFARVTDYNPADNSVGLERDTTQSSATANFNSVADNAEIFLSGGRNQSGFSLGEFFKSEADIGSSDSYIGGKNRSTAANRWLLPTTIGDGDTAVPISRADFNALGTALSYVNPDNRLPYVVRMVPAMHDRLREDVGNDAFITFPINDSREERFANIGVSGLNYQHPQLGTLRLISDPLMQENRVEFLNVDDWIEQNWGFSGVHFAPGDNGGVFYRMGADVPENGKSLAFKTDAYQFFLDWCKMPRRQGLILNRTA